MSDPSDITIDEEEMQFLVLLCSEEVKRCRKEQKEIAHLSEMVLSQKRERFAEVLFEKFLLQLNSYEDDGLESGSELN